MGRASVLGWFVALGCSAFGCGGGGGVTGPLTTESMNEMSLIDVGEMVRMYQVQNNRPPKTAAELESLEMVTPLGFEAVRKGDVILYYGVSLPDTSEEPGQSKDEEILAYQKQAPESGGFVLMKNRKHKKMSAEEFKNAPKAGKGPG